MTALHFAPQFPSKGRVVHAYCDGQWFAAIVTKVHSDTCVNAMVFPDCLEITSLALLGEGEEPSDGAHWRWPPFVKSYEDYAESEKDSVGPRPAAYYSKKVAESLPLPDSLSPHDERGFRLPPPEAMHGAADGFGGSDYPE